ncbi:hypothetical protein ANRL1_03892 [Anaerolineae bacterium]|nr:hypothetical protein ANRL1_03892 [Anaerolineae bacterium]
MSARVCHQAGVCRITQEMRPISAVVRHEPLGQGPHPAVLVPVTAIPGLPTTFVKNMTASVKSVTAAVRLVTGKRVQAATSLILMTPVINNCHGSAYSGNGNAHSDYEDDQ